MTLTSCISEAGKFLPLKDRIAIMASAMKNRAAGMQPQAAAQQAVSDRLGTVRTEIAQAAAAVNQGQDNEVRGTFSPSSNTITLLKKANLSTFAHETGHLYLEILSDLASQEGAPAEIVEDMGKVLKWFGIKGGERAANGDAGGALRQSVSQTDSESFKRWFGDSEVVDVDGKPLVVYHGTQADFSQFQDLNERQGFYFAEDPELAALFAEGPGANTMPVYLSIKRPADLTQVSSALYADLRQHGYNGRLLTTRPEEMWELFDGDSELKDALVAAGYDGARMPEQLRPGYPETEPAWIAFRPEQIKSATGNSGAFDPANPSILKQDAPARPSPGHIEAMKREKVLNRLLECLSG